MTKVISFSSGKGGVGKTSVVVNLGCLFASQGKKTLLIDGDWSLGKLSIMLGVQPRWTVEKALRGEITLEETVQPVQKNLSLLASPTGLLGFEEMSETERNQLYFEIESLSDQFDLILFDHGSGVSWGVTQFAAASHQNVIVTTCEPTSYTDAYAIMKILSRRFAVREFSLLVTMSPDHAETARVIERFREMATSHLQIRLSLLDVDGGVNPKAATVCGIVSPG